MGGAAKLRTPFGIPLKGGTPRQMAACQNEAGPAAGLQKKQGFGYLDGPASICTCFLVLAHTHDREVGRLASPTKKRKIQERAMKMLPLRLKPDHSEKVPSKTAWTRVVFCMGSASLYQG